MDLRPLTLNIVHAANVEEGLLGDVVHVAVADGLEAFDGVLDGHGRALNAGELLGGVGVLRQELLDAACTGDDDLVFFAQFVNAEDGNDVLQFLVLLEDLLAADSRDVVLLATVLRVVES